MVLGIFELGPLTLPKVLLLLLLFVAVVFPNIPVNAAMRLFDVEEGGGGGGGDNTDEDCIVVEGDEDDDDCVTVVVAVVVSTFLMLLLLLPLPPPTPKDVSNGVKLREFPTR